MKIGINYWMFEGGMEAILPPIDAMRQAKELGFESIELCIASEGVLTHRTTKEECREIVRQAQEVGIEISGVATGETWTCSLTANDPDVRRKSLEFTRRALQVTQWLGTDAYLLVPGSVDVFFLPDAEVVPYEICHERAVEAVRQLREDAVRTGVTLAVENVWNKFLLSPLEMREFIDGADSDYVCAYFDVGNILLTGYPDQWIRILGRRIKRVHVKDFSLTVGTVDGFVDLLEGDVDFDAVKRALTEVGYDGHVTAEVLPYEPGRPERTAKEMRKIFK